MNNKFLFMLGLCRKAGKIIIGTDLVTKSLPSKKAYLVIYTSDASFNTEKKVTDKCKYYNTECIKAPFDSGEISTAIGKDGAVCVLGITDLNFAGQLKSLLSENNPTDSQ